MNNQYLFAKCDGCDCDLNDDNGCHSYWFNDNIVTVCDKCSLQVLSS